MKKHRTIKHIFKSKPVTEGAGVRLKRAFGYHEAPLFDPFLLLDDFRSDNPADYMAGFPWHPHRGIETVTYVLEGRVEHHDSLENRGILEKGDVQWMTAGSGIIHHEMPQKTTENKMEGFQLWVNLPAEHKMMNPRYQDIKSNQIKKVTLENNVQIKVICGKIGDVQGPVTDIIIDPEYLDITIPANTSYLHKTQQGYTLFIYIIGGRGLVKENEKETFFENEDLILFDDGDFMEVSAAEENFRFLLVSGRPLNEPVAWRGPIVMNTQEELDLAFQELNEERFIQKI